MMLLRVIWLIAVIILAAWLAENGKARTQPAQPHISEATQLNNLMHNKPLLLINDISLNVAWEHNAATQALVQQLQQQDITVRTQPYGGFEQVGQLPQSLPTDDLTIRTKPGDIMLYQGNQIVVFMKPNQWQYTPLGHIVGLTAEQLENLLRSPAGVTLTFRLPEHAAP